jgi:hypothetical protein
MLQVLDISANLAEQLPSGALELTGLRELHAGGWHQLITALMQAMLVLACIQQGACKQEHASCCVLEAPLE